MNTHTILNIKTDKKLKADAQKIAGELGIPLTTVMNSFLKQFVRDKEVTFSTNEHRPTAYLIDLIEDARKEYATGNLVPVSGDDFIKYLRSL